MGYWYDCTAGKLLCRGFVMAAFAVGLWFICVEAKGGDYEKEEAAKLESMGAKVRRDGEGRITRILLLDNLTDQDIAKVDFECFRDLQHLAIFNKKLSEKSLDHIIKSRTLKSLNFKWLRMSDQAFARLLKQQESLYGITCDQMPLTSKALEGIGAVESLVAVNFSYTRIGDAGVKEITKLENLFALDLPNNNLSDAGLAEVAKLNQLAFLRLDGNAITDAGIQKLSTMNNLRALELRSTKVTEEGIATLKGELPKLNTFR